ncbi:hypothetical protein MMC13_003488 [Lambiella insularis]|nr:hypothetical protein [Lambiella insularis]
MSPPPQPPRKNLSSTRTATSLAPSTEGLLQAKKTFTTAESSRHANTVEEESTKRGRAEVEGQVEMEGGKGGGSSGYEDMLRAQSGDAKLVRRLVAEGKI